MKFSFTEEQQALREVVRDLLSAKCSADQVRTASDSGGEVSGLQAALQEVGVLAILTAEQAGGLGLGLVEACLALWELGYAGAPGPWIERLLAEHPLHTAPKARALRYTTGAAATLCGLSQRMLDMAIEHVKTREQFGRPVGSFQAVQHHLADARLAIELAQPLVWRAAYAMDNAAADAELAVWMAKHHATEAALLTARKALQCHGAMGYAYEHDLQLFMKQVWELAPKHVDSAGCRRRIADLLDL